jgi:hypothetical protein
MAEALALAEYHRPLRVASDPVGKYVVETSQREAHEQSR